ncbi:hypothetical protein [Streptomyces sp. NPDC001661]
MSTPTLDKPSAVRRTKAGPDGLVWTVLRLHRGAMWVWIGYVAVSLGLLLWLWGPGSADAQAAFDKLGYGGAQENAWEGLSAFVPFFGSTFNSLFFEPLSLTRIAACVIAVFAAGPLIARELEQGTAQLAWTQAVSPARWLAAKLTVPAALITAGTTLVVILYRLVWDDRNHLLVAGIGPRDFNFSIGPATVANALFGLAIGVLAALVLRRTLAAAAVAGVVTYLVGAFRGNSWPLQGSYQQPEIPVHSKAITSTGAEIRDPGCMTQHCLDKHDITGFTRSYLPSPDYWPRQLAETGVLLGLTALAVVAAFLVLRRFQPEPPVAPLTKESAA